MVVDRIKEWMAEEEGELYTKNKWISIGLILLLVDVAYIMLYSKLFGEDPQDVWIIGALTAANFVIAVVLLYYADRTRLPWFGYSIAFAEIIIGFMLIFNVGLMLWGKTVYASFEKEQATHVVKLEKYNADLNESKKLDLETMKEQTRQKQIDNDTAKRLQDEAYQRRKAAEVFGTKPNSSKQTWRPTESGQAAGVSNGMTLAPPEPKYEILGKSFESAEDFKRWLDTVLRTSAMIEFLVSFLAVAGLLRFGTIHENAQHRRKMAANVTPLYMPHMLPQGHQAYRPLPAPIRAEKKVRNDNDADENDSIDNGSSIVPASFSIDNSDDAEAGVSGPRQLAAFEMPRLVPVSGSSNPDNASFDIVPPIVTGSVAPAMQPAIQDDRMPMPQLGKGYWTKPDGRAKKRIIYNLYRDAGGETNFICKLTPDELDEINGQAPEFIRKFLVRKAEARNYAGKNGDKEKVLRAIRYA